MSMAEFGPDPNELAEQEALVAAQRHAREQDIVFDQTPGRARELAGNVGLASSVLAGAALLIDACAGYVNEAQGAAQEAGSSPLVLFVSTAVALGGTITYLWSRRGQD